MQLLNENYIYRRTVVLVNVTISAGQTTSSVLDCGGMQFMALKTASTFTVSDISFSASYYPVANFGLVNLSDGISGTSPLVIPAMPSAEIVTLAPYWLNCYPYIKINTSIAQATDTIISVFLEPIFQGVHG